MATVEVNNVECIHETAQAVLCRIGSRELWVPQSQIDDDSEVYQLGDIGTLVITEWFAEREGL